MFLVKFQISTYVVINRYFYNFDIPNRTMALNKNILYLHRALEIKYVVNKSIKKNVFQTKEILYKIFEVIYCSAHYFHQCSDPFLIT